MVKVLDFDSYVIDENGREIIDHHSRLKLYRGDPNQLVHVDNNIDDTALQADDSSSNSQLVNAAPIHDNDDRINNDEQTGPDDALPVLDSSTERGGDIDLLDDGGVNTRPRRRNRRPMRFDDYLMGLPISK